MSKKPNPMGETLGLSDTLEGIAAVVRAFYGSEKTLVKCPDDRYLIQHENGVVVKLTYVYERLGTFYFASRPPDLGKHR